MNIFLDEGRRLRNGWWILIFFAVMASMLVPVLVMARRADGGVSISAQFAVVAVASLLCQRLRRRPLAELTGAFDRVWVAQLLAGCGGGAALMAIPAAVLFVCGFVRWTYAGTDPTSIAAGVWLCVMAAATEELVFRGFVFQRLIDGAGAAIAQIVLAAYFVLTHSAGLAQVHGLVRYFAVANIFLASLLFGLAFLRTRRLALPLGLHFGANLTQGTILGFGVSGSNSARLLVPHSGSSPDWMTGGAFGLEGSAPGLIAVVAACFIFAVPMIRAGDRARP